MYANGACSDPNTTRESVSENCFSQLNMTSPNPSTNISFNTEHFHYTINNNSGDNYNNPHFMQEMGTQIQPNWGNDQMSHTNTFTTSSHQNPSPQGGNLNEYIDMQNAYHAASSLPDYLSLYNLAPSFTMLPPNSENFLLTDGGGLLGGPSNVLLYESRDMLYPHGSNSMLGVLDERERWECEINGEKKSSKVGGGKGKGATKAKEKERREQVNCKYTDLKNLLPNPTKNDKASVIGDAIGYIKELVSSVSDLKFLVEQKRCGKLEKTKRQKMEKDGGDDLKNNNNGGSSSFRSSWLQRKSKETEVDVRIIDDEVTIKLAQRKKINCLLIVSKVLDELQLDIHHVAGGLVGDNFSFLFNTKICEGSCVYASAVADKLIEVVDTEYAARSSY